MSSSQLPYGTNAWLFLNEDEPKHTNYNSPDSCYQTLIKYKIYDEVDFLGIAFFSVVDATKGCTIQMGDSPHPGGLTNQDYLTYILKDARQVNPDIKFLATMIYSGDNTLLKIFAGGVDPQTAATDFANNLVDYLKTNGMNGMDIDWENELVGMTQQQFKILFTTIRQVFDAQSEKYYLTMAPAGAYGGIDYPTLNSAFDIISPQFYDGSDLSEYLSAGMSPSLIGYGAQFEPGNAAPNSSAQQVWNDVSSGFSYSGSQYVWQDIFMWRFNSGNFQFEQAQFMILHQLANPSTSDNFDDSTIIQAAGNPQITQMNIRSGDVLNAVQSVNTGTGEYNTGTDPSNLSQGIFTLIQHGGDSGTGATINIPLDDPIVSISGYTGIWFGWQCVLQLSLTSKSGKTYGPYGSMASATSKNAFNQTGTAGQSVVAFKGSTVTVPLADGSQTAIIASLNAVFA